MEYIKDKTYMSPRTVATTLLLAAMTWGPLLFILLLKLAGLL